MAWAVLHALDDHVRQVLGAGARLEAGASDAAGHHEAGSVLALGDAWHEQAATLRSARLRYAGADGAASVLVEAAGLDRGADDPAGPRLRVEVRGTEDDGRLAGELVHRALDVRPASAGGGDSLWGGASSVVLVRAIAGDLAGAVRRLLRR